MYISKSLIRAFQETHEQKFGQAIPADEAERNLSDLAELIKLTSNRKEKKYER